MDTALHLPPVVYPGSPLVPLVGLLGDHGTDWHAMPAADYHRHQATLRQLRLSQHLGLMHHFSGVGGLDPAHPAWRLLAEGLRQRPPGRHVPLTEENRSRAWRVFDEELPPAERWRVHDLLRALPGDRPRYVYAPSGVDLSLILHREFGLPPSLNALAHPLPGGASY